MKENGHHGSYDIVVVCLIASIALAADPIKLVVNGRRYSVTPAPDRKRPHPGAHPRCC